MNNFTDKWDKKQKLYITIPKKNFYGALVAFSIGAAMTGYLLAVYLKMC